jgi:hypothetical protein
MPASYQNRYPIGAALGSSPPPPFKNLPNVTPPGWHPPILADGTHSSFLHIILHVRLAGFHAQSLDAPLPK